MKLNIKDESGWFDAGDLTEAAAGFSPSLDKVFDVVARDDAGREVRACQAIRVRRAASEQELARFPGF